MVSTTFLLCLPIHLSGNSAPSPTSVANPLVTAIAPYIGTLIVGLIGGWAGLHVFQKRKIISFSVVSLPLLQFWRGMQRVMFLTVPASLLPGSDPTNTSLAQIDNAYQFEITFANVGHEGVTSPELLITLDPAATILDFDCVPASSVARPITMERDQQNRNVFRVLPAFISRGERLVVNLVSTGNSSRMCRVGITGLDVQARDVQKTRGVLSGLSSPLLLFFLQLILFIIIVLPPHTLDPLGFSYRTQVYPVLPVWFVVMEIIILAVVLFSAIRSLFHAVAAIKRLLQILDASMESDAPWLIRVIRILVR